MKKNIITQVGTVHSRYQLLNIKLKHLEIKINIS